LRWRAGWSSGARGVFARAVAEASNGRELHGPALVDGIRVLRWQADSLEELHEFTWGQVSPGTGGDSLHPEWTEPYPTKIDDCDADRIHHLANDMVKALMEHDLDDDALAGFAHQARFVRDHLAILDQHPIVKAGKLEIGRPTVGDDVVLLGQVISWMHDPVGDISVVGQQQQTLRLTVKTADRVDSLRHIDQVHDGPALPLVLHRRDEPARLVEHDESWALLAEHLAIDPDLILRGIDLGSHLGHGAAIDRHPPGPDHRF